MHIGYIIIISNSSIVYYIKIVFLIKVNRKDKSEIMLNYVKMFIHFYEFLTKEVLFF